MIVLLYLFACPSPTDSATEKPDETTPIVDTDTGTTPTDTETTPTIPDDLPPTAPTILLIPAYPAGGYDLEVTIVDPATDPEGDVIEYRYHWKVDGVDSPVTDAVVPGINVVDNQHWEVSVSAFDGQLEGPAAVATAVIWNEPISAPVIHVEPEFPEEGDDITVFIDTPSVDPEGQPIQQTITWYMDEAEVSWFKDLTTVEGKYVGYGDVFRVVVSETDGFHEPVTAEATVSVTYDCGRLPPFNLGDSTLTDARAYHGLSFDDVGNLIGYDGRGALMQSAYGNGYSLFIPGIGALQQIDRLPDGDWVAADSSSGALIRITASGGTETISSSFGGSGSLYGVTVGPDGMVYVVGGDIYRVDPDTGDTTLYYKGNNRWTAHDVNFNLDSTVMYIGTIGSGDVYYMDLDANLDPLTTPAVYASGVGAGWHDGIEVDECGNLWVADYSSSNLYRVETNGTVTQMLNGRAGTKYGHGVRFGSGIGGWRDDAIYQPQPYNGSTVREVVVGFKGGDTVRTWNGVAAPW